MKLYVNENLQPDHPLGLWHYREATPAEVLTHPAVAALVAERDRLRAALACFTEVVEEHAPDCEQHREHLARPGRVGDCPWCAAATRAAKEPGR